MKRTWLAASSIFLALSANAADWPRFRGPTADGISVEKDWLGAWPGGQPKRLWKSNVGVGFASVAVAEGRVFTTGHSGGKEDGKDSVVCLDASSGAELWRHAYPQKLMDHYYEGGTSATPTVDAGHVFTLSKSGLALCLDSATGKLLWSRDLAADPGVKVPEWGFAGAPHIHGNLVIYNAGSAGLALDKATGKIAWSSGNGAAGYATPVPFRTESSAALAIFGLEHVIAVDPDSGRELWRHPWKTKYDVNAADPVVSQGFMMFSSGYGTGASAIRLGAGRPVEAWRNNLVRAHMQSPVAIGAHVYAVDGNGGDASSRLKCLEIATGKLVWESPKAETGVLAAADGKLIWVTGRGELVVVKADPAKYEELARAQVTGGKIWAAPVLANGRLYVRNWKGEVVCLDVKGSGGVS